MTGSFILPGYQSVAVADLSDRDNEVITSEQLRMRKRRTQLCLEIKEEVYRANMDLPKYGLVTFTWGNVSGIDREKGLFVIKPSGVEYDKLTPEDMVVVDLEGNKVGSRTHNPSLRYSHPCGAVQCIPEDRRNRTYPFFLGHQLGTGRTFHSLLWNHTCRLYLRGSSLCAIGKRGD